MSDIVYDPPEIFEAWGSIRDGAHLICGSGKCHRWMLSKQDIHLFSIKGSSYNEIMQAYYDIQGWGKYRPEQDH